MQREVISSIREVAKELGEIKTALTEINCTMREFLNKYFPHLLLFFTSDASLPNAGAQQQHLAQMRGDGVQGRGQHSNRRQGVEARF